MASLNKDAFIRCHEAIHVVCESAVPCIKAVIQNWHAQKQLTIGTCTQPHQCPSKGKPKPPPRPGGRPQPSRSCQTCINWGNAVETVEYTDLTQGIITSLAWTNVNPTVLSQDPVEVAKAFGIKLPKGQPPPVTFDEFDTASLLLMMMKFGEFHQRDHASYPRGGHLYFKVDIIRVKRLSKSTLNTYFSKCENTP